MYVYMYSCMYVCLYICMSVCMSESSFLHPSSLSLSPTTVNSHLYQKPIPHPIIFHLCLKASLPLHSLLNTPSTHAPPTATLIPTMYSYCKSLSLPSTPPLLQIPFSILIHYPYIPPFSLSSPCQSTICYTLKTL